MNSTLRFSTGEKLSVLFNDEWFEAKYEKKVHAGIRVVYLCDGTSSVVPHAQVNDRIRRSTIADELKFQGEASESIHVDSPDLNQLENSSNFGVGHQISTEIKEHCIFHQVEKESMPPPFASSKFKLNARAKLHFILPENSLWVQGQNQTSIKLNTVSLRGRCKIVEFVGHLNSFLCESSLNLVSRKRPKYNSDMKSNGPNVSNPASHFEANHSRTQIGGSTISSSAIFISEELRNQSGEIDINMSEGSAETRTRAEPPTEGDIEALLEEASLAGTTDAPLDINALILCSEERRPNNTVNANSISPVECESCPEYVYLSGLNASRKAKKHDLTNSAECVEIRPINETTNQQSEYLTKSIASIPSLKFNASTKLRKIIPRNPIWEQTASPTNTFGFRGRCKIFRYVGNLSSFLREEAFLSKSINSRDDNMMSDQSQTSIIPSHLDATVDSSIVNPTIRVSQIPVVESVHFSSCFPVSNIVQELPPLSTLCSDKITIFEELFNFERSTTKDEWCVMCGAVVKGRQIIVKHRKDKGICGECKPEIWVHNGFYFKWCQGHRNFQNIVSFSSIERCSCSFCLTKKRKRNCSLDEVDDGLDEANSDVKRNIDVSTTDCEINHLNQSENICPRNMDDASKSGSHINSDTALLLPMLISEEQKKQSGEIDINMSEGSAVTRAEPPTEEDVGALQATGSLAETTDAPVDIHPSFLCAEERRPIYTVNADSIPPVECEVQHKVDGSCCCEEDDIDELEAFSPKSRIEMEPLHHDMFENVSTRQREKKYLSMDSSLSFRIFYKADNVDSAEYDQISCTNHEHEQQTEDFYADQSESSRANQLDLSPCSTYMAFANVFEATQNNSAECVENSSNGGEKRHQQSKFKGATSSSFKSNARAKIRNIVPRNSLWCQVQLQGLVEVNTISKRGRSKIISYLGNFSEFLREAALNPDSSEAYSISVASQPPVVSLSSSQSIIIDPIKRLCHIPVVESVHFSSCFPVSNIVQELPPLSTLCTDELTVFEELFNFERSTIKDEWCVMCGAIVKGRQCVVKFRKDKCICGECKPEVWVHNGVFFKWCQGHRNFQNIVAFSSVERCSCSFCLSKKRKRDGLPDKVNEVAVEDSGCKTESSVSLSIIEAGSSMNRLTQHGIRSARHVYGHSEAELIPSDTAHLSPMPMSEEKTNEHSDITLVSEDQPVPRAFEDAPAGTATLCAEESRKMDTVNADSIPPMECVTYSKVACVTNSQVRERSDVDGLKTSSSKSDVETTEQDGVLIEHASSDRKARKSKKRQRVKKKGTGTSILFAADSCEAQRSSGADYCVLLGADPDIVNDIFRHAVELKAKGARIEAEIEFRRVLELAPSHLDAHIKLGVLLFARGDIDGAEVAWNKAIAINPFSAIAHSNLGTCLCERRNWAEAEAKLRIAVSIEPKHLGFRSQLYRILATQNPRCVSTRSKLASALHSKGDYARAESEWRATIALDPLNVHAHNNLASLLQARGDLAEAEVYVRRAAQLAPTNPDIRFNLGSILVARGDRVGAVSEWSTAVALHPRNPKLRRHLGNIFFETGDFNRAEAEFKKVVEYDPNKCADAHFNIGLILLTKRNYAGAKLAFQRATVCDSGFVEAYKYLGAVSHSQNDLSLAETAYQKLIMMNPSDAQSRRLFAAILYNKNDLISAEAQCRIAIALEPACADARAVLALILRAKNGKSDAEACWRSALSLDPAHAEAHNNLGTVLLEQGNLKGAEEELREAIRLNPNYIHAHFNLGVLAMKINDKAAALLAFNRVVCLDPRHSEAHGNIGAILHSMGNHASAEVEYRTALDLNSRNAQLHFNLGTLLMAKHDWVGAESEFISAIHRDASHLQAHFNLGLVFEAIGDLKQAETKFRDTIFLDPQHLGAFKKLKSVRI